MATEHQEVINHGIDVINSEFKKLMIKNKELQKENDKLKEENEKLKEEYEDLENNYEQLEQEKDDERIEELEKEIVQLKKPLTNKDIRCSPFDVKVNVNYILEFMEIKREEIDFDEYELWKDFDEQVKDNLMIELAQCIEGYINRYCTNPSHQTWSEYICEEFCNDLDELLQNDYYSEHIKYEEDEKGDWKYTPIKNEE